MTRLLALWESMRATYWVVPSIMAVVACALALATIHLDEVAPASWVEKWTWLYTGGADGARGVLSTIAASMIGVAGVTFSITTVVLTLASQQFGPRLLRNFLRDLGNQIVLGTFTSTFLYCLLVLRAVRGGDSTEFVPHVAVTVGVALAMCSLAVLIFFIHHVATSIQASQVIASVGGELDRAIARLYPARIGDAASPEERAAPAVPDADPGIVTSTSCGYVQAVDGERLMALAGEHDLLVRVDASPGAFVREGRTLLTLWPRGGGALPPPEVFSDAYVIGVERTSTQDVAFSVEQLVDLALRALSPAMNDPRTARACVDRLEQSLCRLAARRVPSRYRRDDHGVVRVMAEPATFASMVALAFDEVGRHARASVSVTCHLLAALRSIAPCARQDPDRAVLIGHAINIRTAAITTMTQAVDREAVEAEYGQTMAAFGVTPS